MLAIHGGPKTVVSRLIPYNSLGAEEAELAKEIVESGSLSDFVASWGEGFNGGKYVKRLEELCESYFSVKNAISVNSWTSGLICAVGALNVEPGDEIIVSPWTMAASATAIIHWCCIPIFADICQETYTLDVKSVESKITDKTKAILAVDIFGQSSDIDGLTLLCEKYNLKLICDAAQAPGSFYKDRYTGTIADIGGFSLNCHKHIQTGEGGIIVTNNDELALRMRLIRNHAECVVEKAGVNQINNMIGYNMRMGEIEAGLASLQLNRLENIVHERQRLAKRLNQGLERLRGVKIPMIRQGCTHSYYVYGIQLDVCSLGVSRSKLASALRAEGVPLVEGYVNLHMLPMYQQKIAYGTKGFPWSLSPEGNQVEYQKGICPVAEKLHEKSFIAIGMCRYELTEKIIDEYIASFEKVWRNIDKLK